MKINSDFFYVLMYNLYGAFWLERLKKTFKFFTEFKLKNLLLLPLFQLFLDHVTEKKKKFIKVNI